MSRPVLHILLKGLVQHSNQKIEHQQRAQHQVDEVHCQGEVWVDRLLDERPQVDAARAVSNRDKDKLQSRGGRKDQV